MAGIYASLTNATTGNGSTVDFSVPVRTIACQITATGTVVAGAVAMQLSLDGVNWSVPSAGVLQNLSAATIGNPYTLVSNATGLFLVGTVGVGVRYARVIVTVNVTGGATVTALLSGV